MVGAHNFGVLFVGEVVMIVSFLVFVVDKTEEPGRFWILRAFIDLVRTSIVFDIMLYYECQ